MTTPPDRLDDVCREAHRRGQVVLMIPGAGPVLVTRKPGDSFELDEEQLAKIDRLARLLASRHVASNVRP